MNAYVLVAVPMFILMAAILERSGVAKDLFRAMHIFSGRLRGGLAVQTLGVAVVMAAMTGIIGGEIVLLGLVALPQMLNLGYDRNLAIGTICAGGSLGTMIPPSIVLIFYGLTANVSIGDLFIATIVPGLLLAGLYLMLHPGALHDLARAGAAGARPHEREHAAGREAEAAARPGVAALRHRHGAGHDLCRHRLGQRGRRHGRRRRSHLGAGARAS